MFYRGFFPLIFLFSWTVAHVFLHFTRKSHFGVNYNNDDEHYVEIFKTRDERRKSSPNDNDDSTSGTDGAFFLLSRQRFDEQREKRRR